MERDITGGVHVGQQEITERSVFIQGLSSAVWASLAGEGPKPLSALVNQLHRENRALWRLEDDVRDRALADARVVALKRAIDAHNLARHGCIRAIDAWVDGACPPQRDWDAADAWLNSESVGQMVDRASILSLKRAHFQGEAGAAAVERRCALLSRCLDGVGRALAEARAVRQTFDEAKTYSA